MCESTSNDNSMDDRMALEADHIYVIMRKDYRISRNIRAQWYFNHLNKLIELEPKESLADCLGEIDVISIIPKNFPHNWNFDERHNYRYLITPSSRVTFLSRRYRLVYCLDLSPSIATVDMQHGNILFDEIYSTVEKSLKGVVKPFYIPGSKFLFQPKLYITVFAYVPFCTSKIQQVIVQGWLVTPENINSVLDLIYTKLLEVGANVAETTAHINKQNFTESNLEHLTDEAFEDTNESNQINHPIVIPDISTVNMLRYGMLSLQLLPENSSAGIAIITDGTLSLPNTLVLESLLTQLRNSTICCSFLQIGSNYHPFACFGFVPYADLMNFIAIATCGAYLSFCPSMEDDSAFPMNVYHKAFFSWTFQKEYMELHSEMLDISTDDDWTLKNINFYNSEIQPIIRKKQMGGTLPTSLSSVLSCRLREGYTIDSVNLNKRENIIEVKLLLPWKFNVSIEYSVTAQWSFNVASEYQQKFTSPSCTYEVAVEGNYELLHDVTCAVKKPVKSPYRSAVIKQFWNTLKNLSRTDQLLAHLHSFAHNPVYYTVPESIKNGIPVFYLSPNSNEPLKQKWMHTHRIGILLGHDSPLPKNVHIPNSNGRYSQIQCRHALTLLNKLLYEYSSFVLIENHSYIKFIFSSPDKPPDSFFIIRVTSKAPCMVIRLAFLGGTPGYKRNEIVKELREKILSLKFPKRGITKDCQHSIPNKMIDSPHSHHTFFNQEWKETNCCILLQKPVEKILIRYERMPSDFTSLINNHTNTHVSNQHLLSFFNNPNKDQATNDMLITLSRYLYHQRWIWTVQNGPNNPIPLLFVTRLLSTIIQIRMQEGFHFAHSNSGIINMVQEINMKFPSVPSANSEAEADNIHSCVLQYVIFPPHTNTTFKDMQSQEEDMEIELPEADGELQIITECWIEPQNGIALSNSIRNSHFNGLSYRQLAESIFPIDLDCVSSLLTLEYLSLMCENRNLLSPFIFECDNNLPDTPVVTDMHHSSVSAARSTPDDMLSQTSLISYLDPNVHVVPFSFNVMKLLPKCQQTEMLFSTFIESLNGSNSETESSQHNIPNQLLFEYFLNSMNEIHDRELHLSVSDMELFPCLVRDREKDTKSFLTSFHCNDLHSELDESGVSSEGLIEFEKVKNVPRWKCFVKNVGSSHVLITVLPATYQDLKCLIFSKSNINYSSHKFVKYLTSFTCKQNENTVESIVPMSVEDDIENKSDGIYEEESIHQPSEENTLVPNSQKCASASDVPSLGSVNLPLYVYDCPLHSITDQLIYQENGRHWKDVYRDITFKLEDEQLRSDDCTTVKSDTVSSEGSKQPSPEPRSDDSEIISDNRHLKNHCMLIEVYFQRCFSYALFRSLYVGAYIDRHDVETVTDSFCEESLKEINITHFLQMICGHVKDFCLKATVEQKLHSLEKATSNKDKQKKEFETLAESSITDNNESQEWHFPLEVLQRHQPCESLQQLHSDIKNKFMRILQNSFKAIPSKPDIYYFCPSHSQDNQFPVLSIDHQKNDLNDKESSTVPTETLEFSSEIGITGVEDTESVPATKIDIEPDEIFPDYQQDIERISSISNHTHLGTQSAVSSLVDEEENFNLGQETEDSVSPLFIHICCSIRKRKDVNSCFINNLPTCLGEVINCLKPKPANINLSDIHITLDLLCLTLPPAIESPCMQQTSVFEKDLGDIGHESKSHHLMSNDRLPESLNQFSDFQHVETFYCENKAQQKILEHKKQMIEWMLQDEIASAALNTYPLTVSTLEMVTKHVKSSTDHSCCIMEEVPLQFVFGSDSSLDKFTKEFKMSTSGYHLNKEENFYYLVIDIESSAEELKRPSGSLIPPLGAASKDLIIQANPHGDDSTQLKNITESLYKDKDIDVRRSSDNSITEDNTQFLRFMKMSSESSNKQPILDILREQLKQSSLQHEDETETEDGEDKVYKKSRTSRKLSSKFQRERSREESRASSVPRSLPDERLSFSQNESIPTGQSAPAEVTNYFHNNIEKKQTNESFGQKHIIGYESKNDSSDSAAGILESNNQSSLKLKSNSPHMDIIDKKNTDSQVFNTNTSETTDGTTKDYLEDNDVDAKTNITSKDDYTSPSCPSDFDSVYKFHCTEESLGSTPIIFSEGDFASCIGSGHVSNTEEGYEGDSSESDSDWDWLNALDTKRPLLPRFWLIMEIFKEKVCIYFHIRHRDDDDDEELKQSKEILNQVVQIIKNICKIVNQSLLLHNLHETRMCNQLLVPEASEDIWKSDSSTVDHSRSLKREPSFDDYNQNNYLEATLKYLPGTFDCNVIWQTHFPVHHRLNAGQNRSTISRGIQAMRTVLNSFSVNNRNNMFVYQERSGSVFYLRLHEVQCTGFQMEYHGGEDTISLGDSCSSSMLSLSQKRTQEADDDSLQGDFRPRLSSGPSDKDQSHDTISCASALCSTHRPQQCIALHVHGISEVGPDIKEGLVKALQSKLDDAVLDCLTTTLARNTMCKLMPEDVHFIQKRSKEPTCVLHFTIHAQAFPYIHAISVYLRQNLLHFLHSPKYKDNKLNHHFRPYPDDDSQMTTFSVDDVFLYLRYQALGLSGNKGIACIIMSVVDGQGRPVQPISCPLPSPSAYRDGIASYEYHELTFTTVYEPNVDCRSPGPIALIRFQVWCVGKLDLNQLSSKLGDAVRHALWDLLMEYRLLTAPLCDVSPDEEVYCNSEPNTPLKIRRTGRTMIEQNQPNKERFFSPIVMPPKGHEFSSIPDGINYSSPVPSPHETVFKFAEPHVQKPVQPSRVENNASPMQTKTTERISPAAVLNSFETGDKGKLQKTFQFTLKSFLEYGKRIGTPAITSHSCTLNNSYPVNIVLKEFQSKLNELNPDILLRVFQEVTSNINATSIGVEFFPFNCAWTMHSHVDSKGVTIADNSLPGKIKSYIMIGRNVHHWKACMGCTEFSNYLEPLLLPSKNQKSYQRFQPQLVNFSNSYKPYESTPTSPIVLSRSSSIMRLSTPLSAPHGSCIISNMSRDSSPCTAMDISSISFVPRQRLLLMYIKDKELMLYLYNWSTDQSNAICKLLTQLVGWHNSRSLFLNSIVSQKLGLFHSKPMYQMAKEMKLEKGGHFPVSSYVDIVVKHHSPPIKQSQPNSAVTTRYSSSAAETSNKNILLEILKDRHPSYPLHKSSYRTYKDLVMRHGKQILEAYSIENRDLQDIYKMWQTRASQQPPLMDRFVQSLRKTRLEHYCLTPILFSPSWRWKVAPVRDHTLQPLCASDRSIGIHDVPSTNRSRHSSGSSVKNNDGLNSSGGGMRSRKSSGNSYQLINNFGRSSRHMSEEAWHFAVCSHYIQEYIQYLQTLGFVLIQTKNPTPKKNVKGPRLKEEEMKSLSRGTSQISAFTYPKTSVRGLPVYYLIRFMLGGLLVFEIGFSDPYAFCHLYSVEGLRLQSYSPRLLNSQFTTAFVDELDKIKVVMHLHSFTFDFHLRTIHSYVSGQQLLFRHGYHLTSFLDDFIKYYQKSPSCARNVIFADILATQTILSASQLYNYIISHNKLYGMRVLRMVPIIQSIDMELDTEYALVETLRSYKVSYCDATDVCQVENFDVGLLIAHNTNTSESDQVDSHTLVLKYYIILTSQREPYPKLFHCQPALGTFKPIRLSVNHPVTGIQSRKCSTSSNPAEQRQRLEDSGEHSDCSDTTGAQLSSPPAMCDEEVLYLGYFSSQETLMQQLLTEHVKSSKAHLEEIVHKAALHCRRDFLWNNLLSYGQKDEGSSKEKMSSMNYTEFTELLNLVTIMSLSEIDDNLAAFLSMHISWYHALTKVLINKYSNLHRYFIAPDGNSYYVAVTHSKYQDFLMLLHVNLHSNRADLCLVLRESIGDDLEKSNPNLQVMHYLIEDFVNVCCFHLWTGIV